MDIIRDITVQARKRLNTPEILLFTGARQVGKTTILKQLQHGLEPGKALCHFLNLEDPEYLELLDQSPKNLFKIIDTGKKQRNFIFIDEIQYLKNPTNFLKYFYDEHGENIKLIVSGSSAFYIDRKFKDSLAGRKRIYQVNTLSFSEFLRFKKEEYLAGLLPLGFSPDNYLLKKKMDLKNYEKLSAYSDEFMIFGGYPRVALADETEEKKMVLQDIGYSYIKKDLYDNGVRQENVFFKLMKILAAQTGGILNANELAGTLGISKTAIDNYLYILQKSYHIRLVKPFFNNARKELTKMPKIFFRDTGLRNFFADDFRKMSVRHNKGALLENAAFCKIEERFPAEKINFWRTPQGHEIDFVINADMAFEVKFSTRAIHTKKYQYFLEKYPEITLNFITHSKNSGENLKNEWEVWEL